MYCCTGTLEGLALAHEAVRWIAEADGADYKDECTHRRRHQKPMFGLSVFVGGCPARGPTTVYKAWEQLDSCLRTQT